MWTMLDNLIIRGEILLAAKAGDLLNDEALQQNKNESIDKLADKVKGVGSSGYNVVMIALVYAAAIGLACGCIGMIFHAGNPNKVREQKDATLWRIGAAVCGFGSAALIVFAQAVGKNFI